MFAAPRFYISLFKYVGNKSNKLLDLYIMVDIIWWILMDIIFPYTTLVTYAYYGEHSSYTLSL